MSKVTVREKTEKIYQSETFNLRARSNGYNVEVEYKPGMIPSFSPLFQIDATMISQMIEVLEGLQDSLVEFK